MASFINNNEYFVAVIPRKEFVVISADSLELAGSGKG